jgi:hypothetical protein
VLGEIGGHGARGSGYRVQRSAMKGRRRTGWVKSGSSHVGWGDSVCRLRVVLMGT